MKPLRHLVLSVVLLRASALGACADSLVIPNGYENKVGEGGQIPFGGTGLRNQEIYGADYFIAAMPEGGIISEVRLRLDERFGVGTLKGEVDFEVRMSTTPSLRPILTFEYLYFSANIGADYRTVFSGPINYSFQSGPVGTVKPFGLRIPVQDGFYYDPRQGGLLIEFFVEKAATTGLTIDGFVSADANAIALEGNSANSFGNGRAPFVAELLFTPVPEPPVIGIVFLGLFLVFATGKLRL